MTKEQVALTFEGRPVWFERSAVVAVVPRLDSGSFVYLYDATKVPHPCDQDTSVVIARLGLERGEGGEG